MSPDSSALVCRIKPRRSNKQDKWAEWAAVTFVFPFQASSNRVPAEVQRSPICFIYGFAPGVMHSRRDFGWDANPNEQRVLCTCVFIAPRTCHSDNNQPYFKACSPLTIRRRHVTCCRYQRFTLPFALCCRQRSIILPRLVTPTKETSQARSRGETGKKTSSDTDRLLAVSFVNKQCVSLTLFSSAGWRQVCQLLEDPDS